MARIVAGAMLALGALSHPVVGAAGEPPRAELRFAYAFSLADATGVIPFGSVSLAYDRSHRELFVVGQGQVRIFNESGMETFSFGDDPELGFPHTVAPLENGDLLVLAYAEGKPRLVRCDFRGRPIVPIQLHGAPEGFRFGADGMVYANGKIYLLAGGDMKLLVADLTGAVLKSFDLASKIGLEEAGRGAAEVAGFNVDAAGNVVFTVPALFHAYVLSTTGDIREFGSRGSAPGKFNVVSAIARDEAGNTYVADKLRSVVMVFDPQLQFLAEFGYRGPGPDNLAVPMNVVAADGKVFVAQAPSVGVSVFKAVVN